MSELLKLIQERQSQTALFDPERPVARHDLKQVLEAARWAPTAHNMQNFEIIVVDDKRLLKAIGGINYPVSRAFLRENYRHLSFSEEELKRKKTGLLATTFPPAFSHPEARLSQDDVEEAASLQGRAISSSPVLLVLLYDPGSRAPASRGDFLGIASLGCVVENMWLMASSLGIGFHIVSSVHAGSAGDEVKRLLNIPESMTIAFSVRMGYPIKSTEHLRVRRDIDDFTYHNRFGKKGLG